VNGTAAEGRTWTRRRVLAAVAGLAAVRALGPRASAWGAAEAERPAPAAAPAGGAAVRAASRDQLARLVRGRALALDDPWVLMHAVLALGRDARRGAETILDQVTRRWVEPVARGGATYPAFPLNVEAHRNHFLEIMYAVEVPADRPFATDRMGTITRADLLEGAKALFSPVVAGHELAWTLSVLTAEMRPGADRFTNADGRPFTVAAIVEAGAQAAEVGYADTLAAMRGVKPYGRSALQTYACNGTHVLHGLLDALGRGYEAKDLRARVRTLVAASIYRLAPEVALIDQVIGAGGAPLAALNADAAKLQFLGHSLENLVAARRHDLYAPSAAERAQIAAAEGELAAVAGRLGAAHDLDALARQVPRAYAVVLGDACHALHALEGAA
jgi:hypothetical protein